MDRLAFLEDVHRPAAAVGERHRRIDAHRAVERAQHVLHVDGTVLRANPAFAQIFGYSPEELTGRYLDELIVPAEKIAEYRKQGFQLFQTATEIGLMSQGAKTLFQSLGDLKLADI